MALNLGESVKYLAVAKIYPLKWFWLIFSGGMSSVSAFQEKVFLLVAPIGSWSQV